MTRKNNSSVAHRDAYALVDQGKVLLAAILLLAVAAALGLRTVISADALAPAVATLFFGLAAVAAGLGLLLRRYARQSGILDIAGVLTLVGVIVSIAIEPDQMLRLIALSERPD